jgi:DNA polymerase III sliding clamp (beta) subunit (PCNA family)
MKFRFDVPELQKRLKQLSAVVARKAYEPTYGLVRLSSDFGILALLQGIDLDCTLTVTFAKDKGSADGAGGILLDYRKLNTIIQNIDAKEVCISVTDERATISAGKFKYVMQGTSTSKFDELGVVQTINDKPSGGYTIGLPGLKEQVEQVIFAIPKPDGKFIVPGVLLESTADALRMVATDGFMIAISSVAANFGEFSFVLPKLLLEFIMKLDGGPVVTIADTEHYFYIQTELELLTFPTTPHPFPPYKKVLPTSAANTMVTVDADELLRAVKQIRASYSPWEAEKHENAIDFTLRNGSLFIEDRNQQAQCQITDVVVRGQNAAAFRLNAARLIPFLKRVEGYITLSFISASTLVDFAAGPDYRFLQMPMRSDTAAAKSAATSAGE